MCDAVHNHGGNVESKPEREHSGDGSARSPGVRRRYARQHSCRRRA
jgi:hypothetical protein